MTIIKQRMYYISNVGKYGKPYSTSSGLSRRMKTRSNLDKRALPILWKINQIFITNSKLYGQAYTVNVYSFTGLSESTFEVMDDFLFSESSMRSWFRFSETVFSLEKCTWFFIFWATYMGSYLRFSETVFPLE